MYGNPGVSGGWVVCPGFCLLSPKSSQSFIPSVLRWALCLVPYNKLLQKIQRLLKPSGSRDKARAVVKGCWKCDYGSRDALPTPGWAPASALLLVTLWVTRWLSPLWVLLPKRGGVRLLERSRGQRQGVQGRWGWWAQLDPTKGCPPSLVLIKGSN